MSNNIVKAPNADYYYQIGTKNISFLECHRVLKSNNINNNKFFLQLFDPELADINPLDETLSDELKVRVITEIIRNPWYYMREVVRVSTPGGDVFYHLHLGNLALTWLMLHNINIFLVLPRQNYKTVSSAVIYAWYFYFKSVNSHMLFFNKSAGDSKNNLKRVRDIADNFPKYIKAAVMDEVNDSVNTEYIYSVAFKNRIDAKPQPSSETHADGLGRGATSPLQWYDELAFIAHAKTMYLAAAPAKSEAAAAAEKGGKPHGTVVTTTPNMLAHPSGAFAHTIKTNAIKFRLSFYDKGIEFVKALITGNKENSFVYIEYSYLELGKTEEWFNHQCRELQNDRVKIKRELLLEWPQTGAGSVFSENTIDVLNASVKPIISELELNQFSRLINMGFVLYSTKYLDPRVPYLVGVDTSEGTGNDYHAIVITDPFTDEPIGVFKSNTADDEDIKQVCKILVEILLPNAIYIIEKKTLGTMLIRYFREDLQAEDKLFYTVKEKIDEKTIGVGVHRNTHRIKKTVKVFGVDTNKASREIMIRHLFRVMNENPGIISHEFVKDEIITLERKASNKIEHRSGCHDDTVISWLLTIYAKYHVQGVINTKLSNYFEMNKDVFIENTDKILQEQYLNENDLNEYQKLTNQQVKETTIDEVAENKRDTMSASNNAEVVVHNYDISANANNELNTQKMRTVNILNSIIGLNG